MVAEEKSINMLIILTTKQGEIYKVRYIVLLLILENQSVGRSAKYRDFHHNKNIHVYCDEK